MPYWHMSCDLLRTACDTHLSDAFMCRYIRSLHAMSLQTSLSYYSRASWGPKSPGGGKLLPFLLYLLVQPCQAVSATPKPRVVGASTTSTGAVSTVSQHVTDVAKPCGPHGHPNGARKRAFRRARNRVAQAGPDGHTWYRGRRCSAADLGLLRSHSSIITPLHSKRARKIATRSSPSCLQLPAWPPAEDTPTASAAVRQRGLLSVLSLNLGGLTQHGYDELCTWLHTPSVREQVDVICLQETWRLGSEYLLPDWFWISSGSAPVSGQGVAVLVNRRFASDQIIRFREVQVGRLLHVVVPLPRCGGSRSLDVVCAYMPSKVSESQSTYDKRDKSWTILDHLLDSLPSRNMLYMAGDFNTDLHFAPPFVGVSYSAGPRQRASARDQPRFQRMLAQHQLCALNTWRPEATYRDAQGHTSRVDFILTRLHQARDRRIHAFPHIRLASWRASEGHVLLGGYISIDVWRMAPAARAPSGHDRDALCKACLPGPEHDRLRQVFQTKAHLFQPQLSPATAEKLLLDVCQEAFPRRAASRAGLPWQLPEVQSDLRRVWQLRYQLQRTEVPRRSTALRICFNTWHQAQSLAHELKRLKTRSRQRRREVWMQRLEEGEKALARHDTYALFQVIQTLAPRRSRARVQIRDATGHVLVPEEEALALVSYWSDIFCQGSDARPPRRLQQALHLTPANLHTALRRLKGRKAVAPGNAPAAVWKALAEPLSHYLADYLQAHWTPGVVVVPTNWTDSTLHFLTKPNKPTKRAQDLRPIALQSAGAKAVLLTVKDRLMPFFLEAMVRLPQYAYVAGRGTTEAILRVTLHCACVRNTLQTQRMTIHDRFAGARRAGCVGGMQMSLDLSKAFDMLSHDVLILAMTHAGVPVDLQNVVMAFYDQSVYVVKGRGSHVTHRIALRRGVRQGCILSPALWAMFTAYVMHMMDARNGAGWTSRHCTMYADDMHFAWQVASVEHLDGTLRDVRVVFDVLRTLGMQVNPTKSSLLLGLRGSLADKWLKRHVLRNKAGERHLRYGPALGDSIPIVPSFVYLGVVISYSNFEDLTIRHRLAIAAGHHARLRRVLHAKRVLTSTERARLWTVLIQSAQLYALEAVGLTKEGMRLLHVQTTKHLRGIFSTARHVDGLSDAAFYHKYHLVNTRTTLATRCDGLCRRLEGAPHTAVPCFQWQALLARAVSVRATLPGPHNAKAQRRTTADETVPLDPFPQGEAFQCSRCSLVFPNLHDLKTHEGRAHGIILSRVQVAKNDHGLHGLPTCRHCGTRFAKWHSLSRHISRQGCPALKLGQLDAAVKTAEIDASTSPAASPICREAVLAKLRDHSWEALLTDRALCLELKQRCCLCHQWISSPNGMKAHIRKAHSSTLLAHETEIQVSMHSWRSVMISPCRVCEAVVKDCRQHAGSCVPLFQLLLMSCVVTGHCRGCPQAGAHAFRASPSVVQYQPGAGQQRRESGGQPGTKATANSHGRGGAGPTDARLPGQAQTQGQGAGTGQGEAPQRGLRHFFRSGGPQTHGLSDASECRSGMQDSARHRLPADPPQYRGAGVSPASHVSRLDSLAASQGDRPDLPGPSLEVQLADQPDHGTGRTDGAAAVRRDITETSTGAELADAGPQVAVQSVESDSGRGHGCAGGGHLAHAAGAGDGSRTLSPGAEAGSRGLQSDAVSSNSAIGRGHDRQSCGVPIRRRSPWTSRTSPQDPDHPRRLRVPIAHRRQTAAAETSPPASGGSSLEVALIGLRLRNPDQQCYVNALALASLCWLGDSLTVQAAASHPFFRALRSLSQMRLHVIHHLLSMHDWRQLCVGWHRPRQQHDVHEYMLHVMAQGPAVEWLSQWRSGVVIAGRLETEDHGTSAVPLTVQGFHTLQECVHAWHSRPSQVWAGHSCLAAFCHGVTHVCFVLQRFQYRDRVYKIHEPLHVPHACSLPVWDGTTVTWLSFTVCSVICHEGATPDEGHYRAVLRTLSGKEVITDDGARSSRLPKTMQRYLQSNCYLVFLHLGGPSG